MSNVNIHHFPRGDILVVEDNKSDLKFLSGILSKAGYTVRPASDGQLALRSVQAKLPAMVLLDIAMPGLDGYEICRRLKDSEDTRDIPVVFISVKTSPIDKVKAFGAGGVDYISKPFEPEEVLARVATHLSLWKAQKETEERNLQLLQEIAERRKAEQRLQHLNLVLRAIRNVNQVIARETDRSWLLKGICRSLTEARGYYNAWIALLDESGKLREYAESGLGDDFLPMKERLERGELTRCARRALEQSIPIMTENPPVDCSDCPLSGNYKGGGALTTRLQHGAKCYGIISLSIPAELLSDDEEVILCREAADDIAFALDSLELEERRKKAVGELGESEERYRALVGAGADMGEAIVLLQNTDKVEAAHLFANQEWVRMTGYTPEELREISYFDLIHPCDRDAVAERNRRRLRGEEVPGLWEISIIAKDGSEVSVENIGALLTYQGRPAVVGYIRDITERKKAEERIKASLEEKEVLLKEIHHRVKNNLQVISSLLKLQSGYIEDERYAEMFKESQERVKSMALVHEKLYQSEDLARIDFAGYIESVVEELRRSYRSERAGIGIKTEVENIRLGVDYAIPCGLIINELVSNSLKHAFPQGEGGEVRIAMRQVGEDEVELEVSDNGIGLPESVGVRNAESLGLRLVSMLAEDQLVGEMELDRSEGTKFRIRFRVRE